MYNCGYGALKSLNRFVGNVDSCQKIPRVQVKLHDEMTFFLLGKRMRLLWSKSPKSCKGIIGVHCTETLRDINNGYDGININILMKNQGARPGPQGMHAVSTRELIYYMLLVAHCTQYDCGGGQTFKIFLFDTE